MFEYKRVTIVDENDTVVGYEEYKVALEKNLIRRTACIFVFDTDGKQLLQKRSKFVNKPLKLDKATGGHVDEGENYYETAVREMEEEIGLKNILLTEIASSYRTKEFFQTVYKAVIPVGTTIKFDPQEVDSVLWMTPKEIDRRITDSPEDFTGNYIEIWTNLRDKLLS